MLSPGGFDFSVDSQTEYGPLANLHPQIAQQPLALPFMGNSKNGTRHQLAQTSSIGDGESGLNSPMGTASMPRVESQAILNKEFRQSNLPMQASDPIGEHHEILPLKAAHTKVDLIASKQNLLT